MRKGLFIVFEGGEGSGKSTQIELLFTTLRKRGLDPVITREPGATPLGKQIRTLLLNADFPVDKKAEALLYQADRAQHLAEIVIPALNANRIVISDRYADSSLVYQGQARKLGQLKIQALNAFSTGGLVPDLVILLDAPLAVSEKRLGARKQLDRIEREGKIFHEKIRRGFLKLAKQKKYFSVLDATLSREVIAAQIEVLINRKLEKKKLWKRT